MRDGWREVRLGDVVEQVQRPVAVAELAEVPYAGVRWYAEGVYARPVEDAKDVKAKTLNVMKPGDITYNRMWATKAAFGVADESLNGCMVTNDFPLFVAGDRLVPGYLSLVFTTPHFQALAAGLATGTTERRRLKEKDFLSIPVELPPLVVQRRVVDLVDAVDTYAAATTDQVKVAEASLGALRRMLIDESDAPLVDFSEVATIESALADPTLPGYRDLPHLGVDRIESRTGRLVGVQTAADDGVISGKFLFTEEDVIYSKIRPELRKAAFPRYEGLCSADAYPLRPAPGVDPHYLLELLLSDVFGDEAIGRSSRTKMPKINRRELADIRVPCPDPDGQRQIGELLHSVRVMRDAAAALGETLATIRSGLLEELLSGEREIPGSYDELVGLVA